MNDANTSQPCSLGSTDRRPARARRWHCAWALSAAALVALSLASQVHAITFTIDYDEEDKPSFDRDGVQLRRIARAAADIWSDYILDNQNYQFELFWDDVGGDRLGEFQDYGIDRNIVMDTHDSNGKLRDWFFDPTPFVDEEYAMTASLYRAGDEAPYAGTPPELLESGYIGVAVTPDSVGRSDLLSAVLHEIGHLLGINRSGGDDNYDIKPATLGGAHVSVFANDEDGFFTYNHLEVTNALMGPSLPPSQRRLPSAADILTMWEESEVRTPNGFGGYIISQFQYFDLPRVDFIGAQSTSWDGTLNWIGGRVPDADNRVFVRHGGQARLTSNFSTAAALTVDESSSLIIADNNFFRVYGQVVVGQIGAGQVHVGGLGVGFPELEADSVVINFGYINLQSPSSLLTVNGNLEIGPGADVLGAGTVYVRGLLTNDGDIFGGSFFGGGELALRIKDAGRLDLDGVSEQGRITTAYGNLRVDGTQHEPFSGVALITPGRKITFEQSFAIDGALVFEGDPLLHNTSVLGTELWLRGRIDVKGNAGIEAPLMVFNNPFQETTIRAGGLFYLLPGRMGIGGSPDEYHGRIILERDATLLLNVGLASSWLLSGSMNMTSATVTGDDIINTGFIRGSGTLNVGKLENAGTVNVGDSIGELHIGERGRYVQTASGILGIEVKGLLPRRDYDVLRVTLGATLDGTLSVDFINGYLPIAGARFDVLTASSVSGQFAALDLFAPDGKFVDGRLLYATDRVTLEILFSGSAADFDQDGDVDGKDLARWKSNSGSTSASHMQGDADGDQDVDGADFLAWQRQLGPPLIVAANSAVPEPATLGLLVSAALAVFFRHRAAVS